MFPRWQQEKAMVAQVGDVQAVAEKLTLAKKHVSHSNVCFPPRVA